MGQLISVVDTPQAEQRHIGSGDEPRNFYDCLTYRVES